MSKITLREMKSKLDVMMYQLADVLDSLSYPDTITIALVKDQVNEVMNSMAECIMNIDGAWNENKDNGGRVDGVLSSKDIS